MNHEKFDFDDFSKADSNKSGEYLLWLAVTLDAVNNFLSRRSSLAESFLFDNENEFFNHVAGELGYSAEALRQQIKKALKRQNEPF